MRRAAIPPGLPSCPKFGMFNDLLKNNDTKRKYISDVSSVGRFAADGLPFA